jgi:hypothetical protein
MQNQIDDQPIIGEVSNQLCPEYSGQGAGHPALLIDIVPLGVLTTISQDGKKKTANHIVFVFQVFPEDEPRRQANGQPFYFEIDATTKLTPGGNGMSPSKSYEIITGMRGRDFRPGEANNFDFRVLKNKPCFLGIVHKNNFPQLSKDDTPSKRGIEPFMRDGKAIPESEWPQAELEYYFRLDPVKRAAEITDPDRFKKKEDRQAPTQAKTASANQNDSVIPF